MTGGRKRIWLRLRAPQTDKRGATKQKSRSFSDETARESYDRQRELAEGKIKTFGSRRKAGAVPDLS